MDHQQASPLSSTALAPVSILPGHTPEHLEIIRSLFREYQASLQVDLCFQGFEAELAGLPGKYAPPEGILLLALTGEQPVGCGALRQLGEGTCEMKRLFVRPEFRGRGVGKALARRLVREALRRGYTTMVLDTLVRLQEAMRLYASIGFVPTEPYYPNPLPGVVYWKLDLRALPADY